MRIAKLLWISSSIYLSIVGTIYMFLLNDVPADEIGRFEYIREHWSIYAHQWKAEFLISAFLAIAALIFASNIRHSGFQFIAIGQIIAAVAFPISIAITPIAGYDLYAIISEVAQIFFVVGMSISLFGFGMLHYESNTLPKWIHAIGMVLSGIGLVSFTSAFIGIIEPRDAQRIMPAIMFLYLINSYYGWKVSARDH